MLILLPPSEGKAAPRRGARLRPDRWPAPLDVPRAQVFAALVRNRLEDADWDTRRNVIRTLVRRIEIDGQHIRVVFRVDPGPQDGTGALRAGQRCLGRVLN